MPQTDFNLTPLETVVLAHAAKRALTEYGDDAVLASAMEKLDAAIQEAQRKNPNLAAKMQAHFDLMKRTSAKQSEAERRLDRSERLRRRGLPGLPGEQEERLRRQVHEDPDEPGYWT